MVDSDGGCRNSYATSNWCGSFMFLLSGLSGVSSSFLFLIGDICLLAIWEFLLLESMLCKVLDLQKMVPGCLSLTWIFYLVSFSSVLVFDKGPSTIVLFCRGRSWGITVFSCRTSAEPTKYQWIAFNLQSHRSFC